MNIPLSFYFRYWLVGGLTIFEQFIEILFKIPEDFVVEIGELILDFIMKYKEPGIAKQLWGRKQNWRIIY